MTAHAIWIQRVASISAVALVMGLCVYNLRRDTIPPPPVKQVQVCGECNLYRAKRDAIKSELQTIEDIVFDTRFQAKRKNIDLEDMANEDTLIYWDMLRKLAHKKLHLQQEQLTLGGESSNHAIAEHWFSER